MVFISLVLIPAFIFLLVISIIVLIQWNKVGKLPKTVLSIFLFFIGIMYIRYISSLSYRIDFSFDETLILTVGFIPIILASLIISKLLQSKLKTSEKNIFISLFLITLLFLLFTGSQSSLYSYINRIGQNGIVSDTEIVIEARNLNTITPEKAIEIADDYLNSPSNANGTYCWDIIERRHENATGTYIWDMYRDHWMRKVVISTINWNNIKNIPDVRWKNIVSSNYENETLYMVSFYFASVLHDEDNELIVYVDKSGNVIGTMTHRLK